MGPFRDQEHAAMLRVQRLEDENARLRAELARVKYGRAPVVVRLRDRQAVLAAALSVTFVLLGTVMSLGIVARPVRSELPRVTSAPHVVTRIATLGSSEGVVPTLDPSCVLTVSPARGKYTCRAELVCGGQTVFGRGTSGYENCTFVDDVPVGFTDDGVTTKDGDPAFTVDLVHKTAVLHDDGYTATYTLD